MNWSFLNNPFFYTCLLLGTVAMIPRLQYLSRKLAAGPNDQSVRPNLGERACLVVPSVCIIYTIFMLGSPLGGLVLLMVYLGAYMAAGLLMRGASRS